MVVASFPERISSKYQRRSAEAIKGLNGLRSAVVCPVAGSSLCLLLVRDIFRTALGSPREICFENRRHWRVRAARHTAAAAPRRRSRGQAGVVDRREAADGGEWEGDPRSKRHPRSRPGGAVRGI